MLIDREHGVQVLSCDGDCGAEIHFDNFQDALEYQDENGWKAVPCGGGVWQNYCPDCK